MIEIAEALKSINHIVEKIDNKQDILSEKVVETQAFLKVQQKQYEKMENTLDKTVGTLNKVVLKTESIVKNSIPCKRRVAELESYAYIFKSVPILLKLIMLVLTVITSSFGVYAFVSNL